jgi:hypothetical protein
VWSNEHIVEMEWARMVEYPVPMTESVALLPTMMKE